MMVTGDDRDEEAITNDVVEALQGMDAFAELGKARRRLLDRAMAVWEDRDREALGRLLLRFVQALRSAVEKPAHS